MLEVRLVLRTGERYLLDAGQSLTEVAGVVSRRTPPDGRLPTGSLGTRSYGSNSRDDALHDRPLNPRDRGVRGAARLPRDSRNRRRPALPGVAAPSAIRERGAVTRARYRGACLRLATRSRWTAHAAPELAPRRLARRGFSRLRRSHGERRVRARSHPPPGDRSATADGDHVRRSRPVALSSPAPRRRAGRAGPRGASRPRPRPLAHPRPHAIRPRRGGSHPVRSRDDAASPRAVTLRVRPHKRRGIESP